MKIKFKTFIYLFYIASFIIAAILLTSMSNLNTLKKSVKKIEKLIKNDDVTFKGTIAYNINNKIVRDEKKVIGSVKGKGIAYYDDNHDITIVLEKYSKCAIKLPTSKNITIVKGKCPNYQLLSGGKVEVVTSNEGLYKVGSRYIYKGEKVDNYLEIDNKKYRIISFESDKSIKVISEEATKNLWNTKNLTGKCESVSLGCNTYDGSDIYNYLNGELFVTLPYDLIGSKTFNIGSVSAKNINDLKKQEQENKIEANVGLLSISDYIDSNLGECKISDKIICNKKSYLVDKKATWLINAFKDNTYQAWYLYNDGNIYVDATKIENNIRPVFYLTKAHIISGTGSKIDPFKAILK